MTDIGDERKHKPSAKHTLEEVRKSLEDLVRNEFVDAGSVPAQDSEISDQSDKSTSFAPTPPQRSRQRLQTKQKRDLDTSQVLQSLNELIGGDLSEADHQDADGVQPTTEVDTDIDVDAPAPGPSDTEFTDSEMSDHTESLETLAAELAVVDETDADIDVPASEPGQAELADQETSADTESLQSIAAELALVDEVEASSSDATDAIELMDENAAAEEIPWAESSDVSTDDDYPLVDQDADDSDAAIDVTADMELADDDAGLEEITLAAAPPDSTPEEAPTIELRLDDAKVEETPTPTSSDSPPSPELSLADDNRGRDLTKDTAVPADNSARSGMATRDQPQETMEYPEDEAGAVVSETQQTFDFESLEPGQSAPKAAIEAPEQEVIDEIRPKEPHETAEIPDESPRQAEDSELRLEDMKSVLVEPAGEMVPLVPDEEMSMDLGAELEATRDAPSSTDDTSIEDASPALSPMDALEVPGEEATSDRNKEEDEAAMQNSGHEHSTTISPEKADTTTVLLTPEEAPPAGQESADAPTVELEHPGVEQEQGHDEPVSASSQPTTPTPAEKLQTNKPTGTKQESKPVVTLPSDKPAKAGAKAPTKGPKHKVFTVASAVEAKELKIPGIDFDLGTAADKGTRSVGAQPKRPSTAGDSSPDDSEYIDLAKPASATDTPPPMKSNTDTAPPMTSSKDSYKRTPWPTPSALFRKDSAPKPKRMPWGQTKGVGARAKGSPRVIEPPLSAAKTHTSVKTSDSSEQLEQPKPKARVEPKPKARVEKGAENIPVLSEVVDQPAQSKKPKKKPAPLATPKVASSGASKKKQSRHKALETSSPTSKAEARNVAVNVIAKLNMELRKCGERALSPVTIDRLQFLLREALERYAKDVENGPKRR